MGTLPFIPYFTTSRYRVAAMVSLANVKPGEVMADLGSGDGRIVVAFAQAGVMAHGYELDANLHRRSQALLTAAGVVDKAVIYNKDFWDTNLNQYDIIAIYPMPDIMEQLEAKLHRGLRPNTRVLLNYYTFPHWQPRTTKNAVTLYIR